jgi:hypothetical protein
MRRSVFNVGQCRFPNDCVAILFSVAVAGSPGQREALGAYSKNVCTEEMATLLQLETDILNHYEHEGAARYLDRDFSFIKSTPRTEGRIGSQDSGNH